VKGQEGEEGGSGQGLVVLESVPGSAARSYSTHTASAVWRRAEGQGRRRCWPTSPSSTWSWRW
jgi:hypothetical protein